MTVAWWNDRNGNAQYFWAGDNNNTHTCQCGIDHNCVELQNFCNCDSAAPVPLNDSGELFKTQFVFLKYFNDSLLLIGSFRSHHREILSTDYSTQLWPHSVGNFIRSSQTLADLNARDDQALVECRNPVLICGKSAIL